MRHLLAVAVVLGLGGSAWGSLLWTDSFTGSSGSAPAGWTILAGNGGTMNIQSNTLFMSSAGNGYASGWPDPNSFPVLAGWDQSLPYHVEFDFKIPDQNNHWFFVYVDPRVQTVIDYENDFVAYLAGGGSNVLIMDLATDRWYHMVYDVAPGWGYDVYVDGVQKVTQGAFVYEPWAPLRIGDRANGSTDKGSAYWDNFAITTNIPEPLMVSLLACGLAGLARHRRPPAG